MHYVGVLNRDGGTFRTMDMEAFVQKAVQIFSGEGHTLDARVVAGDELMQALDAAVSDPRSEALLVGGGDGTISAAAQVCFRAGIPLAILPAGTMNLFARSLQIPLALEPALQALAAGSPRNVDIATANGAAFVHQYSVGIHTRLVRLREKLTYRSRAGKLIASARAIVQAVRRPPVFLAEIKTSRGVERREATGISITNNVLGEGHVPYAEDVERGKLGVYVLQPVPPLVLARLCLDVVLGRWKGSPMVSEKEVSRVTLTFPRRKRSAMALIDGELHPLAKHVDLRIHPGGLQVVAPVIQPAMEAA